MCVSVELVTKNLNLKKNKTKKKMRKNWCEKKTPNFEVGKQTKYLMVEFVANQVRIQHLKPITSK